MVDVKLESNLVFHARIELEILGCDQEDIDYMLKIIQAFADVGPSGSQAAWMIPILHDLLQFKNLTPLTNDPKEWNEVGPNVWQSSRRAEAFSENGGKSYYLLSEGANAQNPQPLHQSSLKRN